jgi:hypothetical protein
MGGPTRRQCSFHAFFLLSPIVSGFGPSVAHFWMPSNTYCDRAGFDTLRLIFRLILWFTSIPVVGRSIAWLIVGWDNDREDEDRLPSIRLPGWGPRQQPQPCRLCYEQGEPD